MKHLISALSLASLFMFSCGSKNKDIADETPSALLDSNLVFECKGDPMIHYKIDTIENNVVIHYPDSAGYELNYSESDKKAYDFFGEYDKDDHHTIEFVAIASPKMPTLDEKEHLDTELQLASQSSGLIIHERGMLKDVLYSNYYAITTLVKNDIEYKGLVTLHFDPKLNNYYFVLVQTSDLEMYKHDICLLFPFIKNLRFINYG